ncbi:hypothetical protein AK812_SmicGene20365 [Symbiodinium microadriaticum]|uniref:Uncharacterized protein n=1 Tax=Symbiodinium microadriaticum TaxID=2951 RepID=A0A1Q9DQ76_SYMMI|nr:hypothetical protein AK812_SmicGene20365 [Symbiodinium microadriaticum]
MDAASKQYRHKMRGCYGKQSRRMEKRQPVKRTELCAFFAETRLNSDRSKIVPVVRSFFILLMSTFVLRGVLSSGMSCGDVYPWEPLHLCSRRCAATPTP